MGDMTNIRKSRPAVKTLIHVTVSSGHSRISPRHEVQDHAIAFIKPFLTCALARSGRNDRRKVEITGTGWYIKAREKKDAQGLVFGLWWSGYDPDVRGDSHIECEVTIKGDTATLKAWLVRAAMLNTVSATESPDLERIIFWTYEQIRQAR